MGSDNICDLVREYEEATVLLKEESALKKLPFARLQVLVKAANNGKGTKSYADGQQFLINYVKKNCVCV